MTVVDVRERIERIKAAAGDPELQSFIKEDLYLAVLEFTARGAGDDARLARATIKAEEVPISVLEPSGGL